MKLKDFKAGAVSVEIEVSERNGRFMARYAGDWVEAPTLPELEAKLKTVAVKAKVGVSVPVTILGVVPAAPLALFKRGAPVFKRGPGVRHGDFTGIHGRSGNLMFRDAATGKTEQFDSSHGSRYESYGGIAKRRLTEAEVDEYIRLVKASIAAERALDLFKDKVCINKHRGAEDLVKAALAQASDVVQEDADAADVDG